MSSATIQKSTVNVIHLKDIKAQPVGGKASGLKRLMDAGATVPEGIVIINPDGSGLEEELGRHDFIFNSIPKAVRSSAVDEDSHEASFAGQFDTFLNVTGKDEIKAAVVKCAESAKSFRVSQYSRKLDPGADLNMAVIIQNMVDAEYAGVLFTANPVTNRWDHIVINAVKGLGEELVSGQSTGEQYVLSKSGRIVEQSSEYSERALSDDIITQLVKESLKIEKHFGEPVDLEWALDKSGTLYWLQSRPITTLKSVHLNELDSLDSIVNIKEPVFTRANIGEMMPGPVTPLTWSTFGWAIDYGLQIYMRAVGAQIGFYDRPRYMVMFYNHIFFCMSTMYDTARRVLMTTKESTDYAIMGFTMPEIKVEPTAGLMVRIINSVKYIRHVYKADKKLAELKKLGKDFSIDLSGTYEELYARINREIDSLNLAWTLHYVTSAQSGANNAILVSILSGGQTVPDQVHLKNAASLLVNIGGIDGANAVQALDSLAEHIMADTEHREKFLCLDPKNPSWLYDAASGKTGELFREFLKENGHRCVREAELRETDWGTDPSSLIELLQLKIKASSDKNEKPKSGENVYKQNLDKVLASIDPIKRVIIKKLVPAARASVAKRENSKSICIRIQSHFKKAYINLGELLAEEELLDDKDQIFFLTHQEIGRLVADRDSRWKETASERRKLFPKFQSLNFNVTYIGTPEPIEEHEVPKIVDGALTGMPVSNGLVRGRVKIIDTLENARNLEPGDIMIASYTDVGWTPYFSIIGGLVTEIGSALSHGAVVAREYGIPAVVGVKGAKKAFRDDDIVLLDGNNGIIKLV